MRFKALICASVFAATLCAACTSCDKAPGGKDQQGNGETADASSLERAITVTDVAAEAFLSGTPGFMYKSYNPYTGQVTDAGNENVWEFSSSFEAVTNILYALNRQKLEGNSELYDKHFSRYEELLDRLYMGLQYFKGNFSLISYTTSGNAWSVYGVPRASSPGSNNVTGVLNVYDDQMWLVRDFIEAYKATGNKDYLDEAEYLAGYIIDGWDCTLDENGNENGGITWGPGYTTKHSCSNGPIVAPLVWLSEIYKGSGETAVRRYIAADSKRVSEEMDKSEYYLLYAQKVYDFQKSRLLSSEGVYYDMLGGPSGLNDTQVDKLDDAGKARFYEEVDGVTYKAYLKPGSPSGTYFSYNSGTMLSGAAALYRVTGEDKYLEDLKALTSSTFRYFAKKDATVEGLYTYDFSGNNSWFNAVLLRGYIDASAYVDAALQVDSFKQIYDHAFENFLYEGFMPNSLYLGWANKQENRNIKGRDQFAYAAQFALLEQYSMMQD